MAENFHIDISEPKAKFLQLLDAAPRVILSTKFGDGKTTFLKEIEADDNKPNEHRTISPKYYFVTLHPVNYVVQDNKDIFEIIKRDILVQLLKDSLVFEDTKWEQLLENISQKGWRNLLVLKDVLVDVCEEIPYLKIPVKIINKLINKATDELTEIEKFSAANYISSFTSMKGSIAEDDAIAELIYEGIKHVNNVLNRKTVLIIEDMDRLDPAHMFRILNILAAHIDNQNYDDKDNANKFGFQKVVLVMDYDTTKHIFHHFYGQNANYEGYMRKFSTDNPFTFSINYEVENQVVKKIASECNISDISVENIINKTKSTKNDYEKLELVKQEKSIRDFVQLLDITPSKYIQKYNDIIYKSDFAKLCVYLKKYFPNKDIYDIIENIIKYCKDGDDKFNLLTPILFRSTFTNKACINYKNRYWKYDKNSGRLVFINIPTSGYLYNDADVVNALTKEDRFYIAESIIA